MPLLDAAQNRRRASAANAADVQEMADDMRRVADALGSLVGEEV